MSFCFWSVLSICLLKLYWAINNPKLGQSSNSRLGDGVEVVSEPHYKDEVL